MIINAITILNTYAPPTGYTQERQEHWKKAQDAVEGILKSHLCVWRADAGGNQKQDNINTKKIIGTNTIARRTEPGNGTHLQKMPGA